MNKTIPYGHQDIDKHDIQAVVDVLKSDFLTQGPQIPLFEKTVAEQCGATYALAVSNATAALHLACLALDLQPGDRLWTAPNTFAASANCGRYCGADLDFVDIDPVTLNISPIELEEKLKHAERSGNLPRVVVVVHFSGEPVELSKIHALSKKYSFAVIEDASHAIGGSYEGSAIGSCRYSDMTVFSFHPVKIITTGEGGMILTHRKDLHDRLLRLRTHGITRDSGLFEGKNEGGWYYEMLELGFNYRMTELQAALGTSQMRRLKQFIDRRHELADRYDRLLAGLPLILPQRNPRSRSGLHLYVTQVDSSRTRKTRLEVYNQMIESGVGVNVHYIPVHLLPYYKRLGFKRGDFPHAERYYDAALTLPMFASLTEADQDHVVESLKRAFGG